MINDNKGKIYVASMNMRGVWAKPLLEDAIKINVTSAQPKSNRNRIDFSPMTHIEGGYKGFWNFESYWQSGKVFENISPEITRNWWCSLKEPKRRYPNTKNNKVLYAKWEHTEDLNYVDSRKKVYVTEYAELIRNKEMTKYWIDMHNKGHNLIIYDFDGPRNTEGAPICVEFTKELYEEKIEYTQHPFGHGYVVAALISGLL